MQECECDEKQKARQKLAEANCQSPTEANELVTPIAEAKRFAIDCLKAIGTNDENANTVADNLITADYRGIYSHGMNRLDRYINDVKENLCVANAVPTVEKETAATAVVNGNNAFGAVVGKFCMDMAIKKAKDTGIGFVVAHGSNHYGISGVYTLQAIGEGCIGMAFTNTSPCLVPTRAKDAVLGTNPIAIGAPALGDDSFVLDVAVTVVSAGQIELKRRKGEPIPEGWALNENGLMETDADKAIKAKKLLPLGGSEQTSGYKGYGLAMMVEILSGIISGSAYGPNIRTWMNPGQFANLGQSFLAIDPKQFVPGFEERLSDLMNYIRKLEPVDPDKPVLVHGDHERISMEKCDKIGGLIYVRDQHESNAKLAAALNVPPMRSK